MFSLAAFTSTKREGELRQPTHHGEIHVFLGSVFTGQRHFFLKMALISYIPIYMSITKLASSKNEIREHHSLTVCFVFNRL